MYLEVNGSVLDEPVSNELIENAVYSLTGDGDSFLILSDDEMTYIQASGDARRGFTLEYQDGSLEQHYYCTDTDIPAGKVIDAFRSYFAQEDDWKNKHLWQREEQTANVSPGIVRRAVVIIILAILVLIAWPFINAS